MAQMPFFAFLAMFSCGTYFSEWARKASAHPALTIMALRFLPSMKHVAIKRPYLSTELPLHSTGRPLTCSRRNEAAARPQRKSLPLACLHFCLSSGASIPNSLTRVPPTQRVCRRLPFTTSVSPSVTHAAPKTSAWAGEASNATKATPGMRAAIRAMGRCRRMASCYRPARSKPRCAGDDVETARDAGMAWGKTHKRAFQSQCPLAGDNRSTVAVREKVRF